MKNLENAKELNELEEKEVAGGHISIVSPGETPNSIVVPYYLNPKPDVDPNIKTDGFGGPGPAGITYTW